ncbi:PAS and ANTAR domain-containing protein [Mycobacterium sp. DL592]|uniref:PAS and ANTAR domain-containing protein n=1 Tax=Mycobacterium sp. DL592 TaxID=2675524 RepID=UPI00141DA224|nr:PAS and ANTAR domain-containing protein [Mycobacterium sp. DL592]
MQVPDDDVLTGGALAGDESGGRPEQVGWFRFYFADERWEWSPEVQLMHGYQPGTVSPTTELVLSHKHPDDYQAVANTLDEVRRHHQAFSTRHRILDTEGRIHHVIVVADKLLDDDGVVVGTHGFYVDVSPAEHHQQRRLTEAIAEIAENRAAIEQAKGMLMIIYGIEADAAFDLLRWRSQEANIKLRVLAEQVVTDFVSLTQSGKPAPRSAYDNLLLTADRRIGSSAEPQPY